MYEEYSKKFGELKAEAAKLEEELKVASIVNVIIKYPIDAKDLPIDYDILMLNAIIQHCTIKNINPKVKAGELLAEPISRILLPTHTTSPNHLISFLQAAGMQDI